MSIIIIGKIMAGGAALSVVGFFGYKFFSRDTGLDVYALVKATSTSSGNDLTYGNYQCRFKTYDSSNITPFSCTIEKPTLEDASSKKHFSKDKFANVDKKAAIKLSELTTKDNFYKINITYPESDKAKYASKSIEVFSKDPTLTSHAELSPLFAFDNDEQQYWGKTKYFVGRASVDIDENITSYKCSWTSAEEASTAAIDNCKIYGLVFGEAADSGDSFSELTFQGNLSTPSTKVVARKYYVIEFKEEDINTSTEKTIILAEDSSKQTTFTNIHKAAFAKDNLLILEEYKKST